MIKRIKLTNFRQFKKLELNFEKNVVVLHGNNAIGKSSILEAICLITNGTSPWASSDEFISYDQNTDEKYTRIEMETQDYTFSFFKDKSKKELKIDGHNTTAKKFFEKNASTIFNPEQIEILMISPSKRRNFIDDAIVIVDYEYVDTLKTFNKVLKQRNAYLKKLSKNFYEKGIIARNDPQLNFWTNEFISISNIIQSKRLGIVKEVSSKEFKLEYIKSNKDSSLEECIEDSKKRDIATGYTNIGPHRDDWDLINGKNIKKFGSRGEKRLAIGKLIFRIQEIVKKHSGTYPILLLDDISSELDKDNTKLIFEKENIEKQQTFITVISYKELPKDILSSSQLIDLNVLR
ncbi:MAG: DNA replication/repair protein RecF [Candidatus Dojkabacteria bacterium]